MRSRLLTPLGALVAWLLLTAPPAGAQYPERPLEVIVPIAPGGGMDLQARLLAEVSEPFLKQKLVIVNKPGGGGSLGVSLLTQAAPDGYTIAAVWNGPLTILPATQKVAYAADDYVPILQFSAAPLVLCARADFPANDGRVLVAHLKDNPNKYTFGNEGVNGTTHLALERVFGALGVKVRPIPFGGASEVLKNFLGDHITFYAGGAASIAPHVKSGKAKCLLLSSAAKNEALPQATSLGELGIAREETLLWRAFVAPKGVTAERLALLERALRQGAETPRFREFIRKLGETPMAAGPAEVSALIRKESAALAKVAEALGLKR